METLSEVKIEKTNSSIKVHTFTASVAEKLIKFEAWKFRDSIFLWIGDKRSRNFNDLSLSLITKCDSDPVSTKIMGHPTDLTSNHLSCKLSKKLCKPVYVSYNLTEDRLTVPVVNKRIAEEIQKYPEFF